jgi:hypothetical protein
MIEKSPVAAGIPFDNTGLTWPEANLQEALAAVRSKSINDQTNITTSASGTTTLTSSSNSLQILTGSATGHSVVLPNATTLTNGHLYNIFNLSSQSVLIKNNGGTTLATLKANAQTFCLLYDNTSANGTWALSYTLDNGNVFGTLIYYNEDTSETSTSSTTTFLNKVTLTTPSLPLGDYLCQFQFIWRAANANRILDVRVQKNSVNIQAWNPFTANTSDRQLLSGFIRSTSISGVNTYTLDFKVSGSATTVYMKEAKLFVWRIA